MTSSRDCLTTEQKIAFMQKAMSPDFEFWIMLDGGTARLPFRYTGDVSLLAWDFAKSEYELRPRKLTDAEKVSAMLEVLDHPELQHNIVIAKAVAIGKGESNG